MDPQTMQLDARMLGLVAVLTTAIVQAVRQIPLLAGRDGWLPLIAVATGVLVAACVSIVWPPPVAGAAARTAWMALHGVAGGLSASGLYSLGAKKVLPGGT